MIANNVDGNIETYTGRYFDYADPQPEQVHIADIARALSMSCRYGGHVSRFYSIAEHAVLVARLVEGGFGTAAFDWQEKRPGLVLAALHHDSHEAYMGDVPTPLKRFFASEGDTLPRLEAKINQAIAGAIGFDPELFDKDVIAWADNVALRLETLVLKASRGEGEHWAPAWERWYTHSKLPSWAYSLMGPTGMSPAGAESAFLSAHERLSGTC